MTIGCILPAARDPRRSIGSAWPLRGIWKGAHVYLGRAQVALKDMDGAKTAFANLKSVPNVSPRVLSLYADTLGP